MIVSPKQAAKIIQLWGSGVPALECGEEACLEGTPAEIRAAVMKVVNATAPAGRGKKAEPQGLERFIETTPADDLAIPVERRKTLLELTKAHCHWPVGDPRSPDFFFCGDTAIDGQVYCGTHCRRAYNGPAPAARQQVAA